MTGGLGAGKSTALRALARLGAEVLSTDAVVHELYETPEVRDAVVARFGPQVARGGRVDRAALAELAFASEEGPAWLEGFLWPRVAERVAAWRATASAMEPSPVAAVVETPLLFEAGLQDAYDATIAVVADERLREARARARGHRALAERAARQLSQDEKAARATFVVVNDGTVLALEARLTALLDELSARATACRPDVRS
ncbi:MAG: dephospho-CoA kinase [Solirubrobacteraceae bacterium]